MAITQKINAFFQTAMDAFLLDHPEYFWVDGGNCSIAMSYSTKPYSASEGKIDVSVVFIGNWTVKSGYDGYEEEYQQVVQKIKAIDAGESRFYILKKIHDFLCDTIVYDKTALRHGDAAGALLDGKAVCQGYAHAFKIACDFYNIPCICVTGTGLGNNGPEAHMWNYVQMEDGFWYAVDCTWDDGIQKIYYDYFLSGISTVDTYFGKNTFEDTHIADGRQTSNSEKTFIYPALAANAYVEQGERLPATQIPEITPENNITAVPTENITALPTLRETEGALNLEEETNLNTGELDTEEAVVQKTDECSDSFHSKESIEKKKSLNLWVVVISVGTAMVGLGLVGILFVKRRQHSSDHTAGEGKINDNR